MTKVPRSGNAFSAVTSAFRFLLHPKEVDARRVCTRDGPFAIPAEVCSSMHADGLALFHTGRDLVFRTNQTGSRIWQGVARGDQLDAITTDLSREYGIPEQEAIQATVDFIYELQNQKLVNPAS